METALQWLLWACRMQVMQLMRQDVAILKMDSGAVSVRDSAARGTLAEGRVLSQCAAKSAAHLSRQPARSLRRRPLSAPSL